MAGQPDQETEAPTSQQRYTKPHSGKHPIPTIQGYREHRKELQGQLHQTEEAQHGPEDESKPKRAFESAKAVIKGGDDPSTHADFDPYPSRNRNYANESSETSEDESNKQQAPSESDATPRKEQQGDDKPKDDGAKEKTATETVASTVDPRKKRKTMKKTKRNGGGREVTDPVTHLPLVIHDQTEKDLDYAPENEPEPGTHHQTATGVQGASKSDEELEEERRESQKTHNGTQQMFPPPQFEQMKQKLARIYQTALYAGFALTSVLTLLVLLVAFPHGPVATSQSWTGKSLSMFGVAALVGVAVGTVSLLGQWVTRKASDIFEDETWEAARTSEKAVVDSEAELPESVQWLNSLFASIWPLINPDLFSSLGDMVEDVMQASLPKTIKMVSVDDMGQGSEAIRILGVRWLPTGAASQSVDSKGQLRKPDEAEGQESDRTNPQGGTEDSLDRQDGDANGNKDQEQDQDQDAVREGMEAEEGDFVNLELAFAYRSRSSGKSIRSKAKNAHLYLKFYLPGGIAVPVWVELRGIIGTARLRLQLTPDPPFISLCTLTFLGQPKANLSCVPLSKHSLNLMNVPLISSFVQSAIDAALAEYVAPKSLTLNFKDMLVGEDFKANTDARGVVWIFIKHARDFKEGDGGVGPMKGSSDSYVTVSWGKFGKPVASTRIIQGDQAPSWHEYASILVTPEELNADEKLRLQLWDSDKWTADDDLGRVELDLKQLMNNSKSYNRLQDREDPFSGEDADEKMPGSLTWSVGYFDKTRITERQLAQQTVNEDIRSKDELEKHASELAEKKLREANKSRSDPEVKQQTAQDYRDLEDAMVISAPPSPDFCSGILSVQIHNITGLQIQKLNKKDDGEDEELPSAYCCLVLNHAKVYRTRTKPKNAKPFFNAGTERFVRDWRDAEAIVLVRDSREGEDDPLIGIVYLPLAKVFAKKAQVVNNYPLVGGVGYGRARISLVWRSCDLKLPRELAGWDLGTLEIKSPMRAKAGLPEGLKEARAKIRTNTGRVKLYPAEGGGEEGRWELKKKKKQREGEGEESAFLAVRKRYASAMVVEFRESRLGPDKTPGFAVLWLNELVDEEDQTVTLKVWKGDKDSLRKAETSCGYTGRATSDKGDGLSKDQEQPLGEVELTVRFWRGLSGYHKGYAAKSKNKNLRDVMECLDTITDEGIDVDSDTDDSDTDDSSSDSTGDSSTRKKLRVRTNDDASTPSSSDSEDGGMLKPASSLGEVRKGFTKLLRQPVDGATTAASGLIGAGGKNDPDDGSRGVRSEMRDYKAHHRQLHRKHRGVMQWRVARQAEHVGGKLGQVKGAAERVFKHDGKEQGVETEV